MLVVGIVRRPHGLAGEVSVEVLTDFPERFVPGSSLIWRCDSEVQVLEVARVRPHGKRLLLSFEGIGSPDAAAALAGGDLCVLETEAVPAPPDFYYSHEIAGWRCEGVGGRRIGLVTRLEQTPAGPLLTIEMPGKKEVLVPFVRPIVVEIDREARRIVLNPPEGLLEL